MSSETENTLSPLGVAGGGLNRILAHNDVLLAIGLASVLATLVLPLPTFVLDLLLACSIAIALATLLIVLSAKESIELSTFPSLLLFLTLFRLSLNVASTRLILLQGDAGQIIETFGQFVVGGNLVIGLVVFLILVVIQFVVITKGSERISEVSARFNLDAMPGKQMAIDADLNAGLIGEEDARARREKIVRESEFYGAMDGASKFIRGDAVAGLIITAINLVGGFLVGLTRGLEAGDSVRAYSILAIGDGLVSQIPALIISTSAGFLVTKTSSKSNLSDDLARQLLARSRPLSIASFLFASLIVVPGFPKAPFVVLAVGAGLLSRALRQRENELKPESAEKPVEKPAEDPVEELLNVDRVSLQVGSRLIKVIDPRRKNSLSHRIGPLRRKFAQQFGVILPLVRLRDDPSLDPNVYEIRLNNHVVGSGQLEPDRCLAMDPGTVQRPISGQEAREPVFGLPGLWVTESQRAEAEVAGYTVVDPESVLVTHLSETLRRHAHEVISRDDVQQLVDRLREMQPALINSVVGDAVPVGLLHRVLQGLLRDGIPVRDLAQILEVLGDHASRTKDPAVLTELARKALARAITEQHTDDTNGISAIVLTPSLEHEIRTSVRKTPEMQGVGLPAERAMELCRRVATAWKSAMDKGLDKVVFLCDANSRAYLASLVARQVPQLPVVAYDEIVSGTRVESAETVSLQVETVESELVPG
jgi:flagellar biosynthesis protein FlhA